MIPFDYSGFDGDLKNTERTSFTYEIKKECDRIKDYIDGIKAVCQAVYKILMTEKGVYDIYDEDFGITLSDLFGKSVYYAQSELPVRIENALLKDERILSVFDFSFYQLKEKGSLLTKFSILTVFGETSYDLEVKI